MKSSTLIIPPQFASGRVDLYILFSTWSAWILALSALVQCLLFYKAGQADDVTIRHAEVQPATLE